MTTDDSRRSDPSLAELLVEVVEARRLMKKDGAALAVAFAKASSRRPEHRAALKALLYAALRRAVYAQSALARLCDRRPQENVALCLETAIALLAGGLYKDYTLVDNTVRAVRMLPGGARAAGFANAVLRRYLREAPRLRAELERAPSVRYNVPAWWAERMRRAYPEEWESVLAAGTRMPPLSLRVNVRRTSVEDYLALLAERGMPARRIGEAAVELEKPVPAERIPGFGEGLVSVQDAGMQLAARLLELRPGDRVLDACAAPGGKTAHLLERYDCRATALEIDPKRTPKIHENLERLGLKAEVRTADAASRTERAAWWSGEAFDAILLDAPCTASGIVRRQPDVPWNRRPEDIRQLAATQSALLDALWEVLKPAGHLLFCTCSVFPEEGPEQIQRFLERTPDARAAAHPLLTDGMLRLLPTDDERPETRTELPSVHDGLFFALLEKQP